MYTQASDTERYLTWSEQIPPRTRSRNLWSEAERRVAIGDQHVGVRDHAVRPAADADEEVEHPAREATGEEDHEPSGDHDEERGDVEEEQHHVVWDRQQPLDQRQPAVEVGARVRIGKLEMHRLMLVGGGIAVIH